MKKANLSAQPIVEQFFDGVKLLCIMVYEPNFELRVMENALMDVSIAFYKLVEALILLVSGIK